jgi:hypothetical protein
MSAFLTFAADPSTVAAINHIAVAHGPVLAGGISDTANSLISTWSTVIRGAAGLAALIIILVTAVKTRLAIASTLLSVVVAGFLLWAVTANGLGWFSTSINQEVNHGAASSQVISGELL